MTVYVDDMRATFVRMITLSKPYISYGRRNGKAYAMKILRITQAKLMEYSLQAT